MKTQLTDNYHFTNFFSHFSIVRHETFTPCCCSIVFIFGDESPLLRSFIAFPTTLLLNRILGKSGVNFLLHELHKKSCLLFLRFFLNPLLTTFWLWQYGHCIEIIYRGSIYLLIFVIGTPGSSAFVMYEPITMLLAPA